MIKNNKILKILLSSLGLLLFVVAIVYLIIWNNDNKLYGKLAFSDTYNRGELIDKIVLQSTEETVVLLQKNNYWLLENKNNYYADFTMVHKFLNSFNNSIYSVRIPYNKELADEKYLNNPENYEKNSGILIRTYIKDELVDEMIVGLPAEDKNYYFARNFKDNNIWLISGNFDLPLYAKDWILRPLFAVLTKKIESITIDGETITTENEFTPFYNKKGEVVKVDLLSKVLSGIYVVDALDKEKFSKILAQNKDIKNKKMNVVTSYGLIVDFDIYYNDKQLWSNIKLSTSSLPLSVINDYIKDSNFLYDGWYFEISPEQGHILRYFNFM